MHNAILQLSVWTSGGFATCAVLLADPPIEKDCWVEQGALPIGGATFHALMNSQGQIRLRIEPSSYPSVSVRCALLSRPKPPEPPEPR